MTYYKQSHLPRWTRVNMFACTPINALTTNGNFPFKLIIISEWNVIVLEYG